MTSSNALPMASARERLLNAAAGLPTGHSGRDTVRCHKQKVEALLAAPLIELVGNEAVIRLARQLAFVLEGAMARAGLGGNSRLVHEAHDMAAAMLEAL